MTGNGALDFKIGIVGPTRCGKTSLIASILKDSQRLLEGTPVSISPHGTPTERRIAQHHAELEGSLRAGEFHAGALGGTQDAFVFELHLDPGSDAAGIHLNILDYPGGWLDPQTRLIDSDAEWQACKRFMTESSVLIVPVESPILMEAVVSSHKKAMPRLLIADQVADVARRWAKARAVRSNEPALLLLCPMKCESYFSDNGGRRDASADLLKAVRDMYRDVLHAVRAEASHAKIVYAPVDTFGCVEIAQASWSPDLRAPKELTFAASYMVRPPGRQMVKGADAVLVSLCKHLIEAKQNAEKLVAADKQSDASAARRFAERDEGFLGNLWLWVSGKREQRRFVAGLRQSEATAQQRIVETLDQTIERLASRDLGPRVHAL